MISPRTSKAPMQRELASSKIMTPRFNSKGKKVTTAKLLVNTNPSTKVEVLGIIKILKLWESSRTRWNPARNTENRRRNNSGHAHTTIAEGLEGREGTCPLVGGKTTLSNSQ
ncbi:unnamed protein product [Heterobilharzia americana]|nr:unnamed protein product [Heterobilharzia americana]